MKTKVVNRYKEGYTLYIGRPSKWGNPFPLTSEDQRLECLKTYVSWLQTQKQLLSEVKALRGEVLGCFCAPKMCHGDVLVRLADSEDPELELSVIISELNSITKEDKNEEVLSSLFFED